MSDHFVAVKDLPPEGERLDASRFSTLSFGLMVAGAIGLIISLAIFFLDIGGLSKHFAYSWLFAIFVFFTFSVGGLFWTLVHNATSSGWGIAVRRILEVMGSMFPVLLVLALPLLLPNVREALWEWMSIHKQVIADGASDLRSGLGDSHAHGAALLKHKFGYLSFYWGYGIVPGWLVRFFLYFILLALGAKVLLNYSLTQDETRELQPTFSARRFSCAWLPIFAVCMTFAAVDWVKALNFTWFSTMWGVYIFAGSALSALALLIINVSLLKRMGYLKIVNQEHYHIIGKLMHAFVIFWAYISFSQFFLIWYAGITEETQFYILRNTGGWNIVSIFLMFSHFIIPFVILLLRAIKKTSKHVTILACWIIFAHLIDVYWMIIPERAPSLMAHPDPAFHPATAYAGVTVPGAWILDILALLTVASIMIFFYLRLLSKNSLYPCGDPRLQESANLVN